MGSMGMSGINTEEPATCGSYSAVEFVHWREWFLQNCCSHGALCPSLGAWVVETENNLKNSPGCF